MRSRVIQRLAEENGITVQQVEHIISMRESGAPIPYIAVYRSEEAGGLDESEINQFEGRYRFLVDLEKRKATILHTIQTQNTLSRELQERIENSFSRWELEDLYLPYKPKHVDPTKEARERKLDTLARTILEQSITSGTLEDLARAYISEELNVPDVETALAGASQIIIQMLSEDADLRGFVRDLTLKSGSISTRRNESIKKKKKLSRFDQYFSFSSPIDTLQPQRMMIIKRGVEDGTLIVSMRCDEAHVVEEMTRRFITSDTSIGREFLLNLFRKTLNEVVFPSILSDVWYILKERAENEITETLCANLQKLILAPPFGNKRVIGIDPGLKSGCALAVVDEQGAVLELTTIFPHDPRLETENAKNTLLGLIEKHQIEAVAIGDGPSSRETDHFIKDTLREMKQGKVTSLVISDIGAKTYAASRQAQEDYPEVDLSLRSAISIARRFQDPLREMVTLQTRMLNLGQFHHDVNQLQLRKALRNIIEWSVNFVGVDLNQATVKHLSYVAGLTDILARRIVRFREEHGTITRKTDLLRISQFGKRTFQFAAGFLRVPQAEFPLERTAIHPDHYSVVERIATMNEKTIEELVGNSEFWGTLNLEKLSSDLPMYLHDLEFFKQELLNCGLDRRPPFELVPLNDSIGTLEDIKPGLVLKGRISNVTDFGAFVDIGVHQDGLIHISEISNDFVREAHKVLSVGDIVSVQVLKVDLERKRISLSMKVLEPRPPQPQRQPQQRQPEQSASPRFSSEDANALKKKKKKKKKKTTPPPQPAPVQSTEPRMPSLEDLVKHFNRL